MPRHASLCFESDLGRRPATSAVILAITLVASACAALSSPPPLPSQSIATAPSSTPVLTARPQPTSQPTPSASTTVLTALPDGGSSLFPGHYTTNFQPALELTIDREVNLDCAPGYRCRGDVDVNVPTWVDLEFGHDHPIDINIMRFDRALRSEAPRQIASTPGRSGSVDRCLARPDRDRPGAGARRWRRATQVDVQAGAGSIRLGPSGETDPPTLGFGAHQLRRLVVLRVDGVAVFVQIGSVNPVDETPARLTAAIDELQPIVDSITWQ